MYYLIKEGEPILSFKTLSIALSILKHCEEDCYVIDGFGTVYNNIDEDDYIDFEDISFIDSIDYQEQQLQE